MPQTALRIDLRSDLHAMQCCGAGPYTPQFIGSRNTFCIILAKRESCTATSLSFCLVLVSSNLWLALSSMLDEITLVISSSSILTREKSETRSSRRGSPFSLGRISSPDGFSPVGERYRAFVVKFNSTSWTLLRDLRLVYESPQFPLRSQVRVFVLLM